MKLRRHATSIVFIVGAVAVSAYAYFVDRGTIGDPERTARGAALLPAFRHDEVTRVELSHGEETLVLARVPYGDAGDTEWRMEHPGPYVADAAAVQTLLDALDHANVMRRAEGAKEAFAAPRARGVVTMGKIVYRFTLGGEAAAPEGASYLRLEGEGTYLVGRELASQLLKDADDYRERTVVPYLSIALRGLRVEAPGGAWAIERSDDVSFRFVDPPRMRASRDALDRVWSALGQARSESFPPYDEAKRVQTAAEGVVTVRMTPKDEASAPGVLTFGGVCPGQPESVVVLRASPSNLAACVPKIVLEGLGTPRESLYDGHLFAARFDEVEELRLSATGGAGEVVEIARKGSGWYERSPDARELAKDEVDMANALVTSLVRGEGRLLEAGEVAALAFAPRWKVAVRRAETGALEEVEIGAPGPSGPFTARRAADGALLALEPELARKTMPRPILLHGSAIWSPPLEGKTVTHLATRCGGLEQELVREDRALVFRRPAGFPADNAAALDVFEAFARAKAESWVADADDGSFGLATGCKVTVGVASDGGTRTETLLLGREGEGGVYARVEGKTPVFVIAKSVQELSARPLVDRNAFFVEPARVASLVLRRGAKSRTFDRGADAAAGEEAVAALGRLRAEAAIHLGPARPDEGFAQASLEARVVFDADAGPRTLRFVVGAATTLHDQKVYYARVDGVQATFVVGKERLDPLLRAVE